MEELTCVLSVVTVAEHENLFRAANWSLVLNGFVSQLLLFTPLEMERVDAEENASAMSSEITTTASMQLQPVVDDELSYFLKNNYYLLIPTWQNTIA